jgi:hypothetical protein
MNTRLILIALFIALIVSTLPTFSASADDNNVRSTDTVRSDDLLPDVKVWSVNPSDETTVTETTPAELIPMYSCSYTSTGEVVSCVFVGWADPSAPEL